MPLLKQFLLISLELIKIVKSCVGIANHSCEKNNVIVNCLFVSNIIVFIYVSRHIYIYIYIYIYMCVCI